MDVPTRLSQVEVNEHHIDDVLDKLKQHGMTALGEQSEVTLDISRKILELKWLLGMALDVVRS